MIVCNTCIFEHLTKGGEYEILDTDDCGCVVVENNAGQRRAYHSSWFY